MFIRAARNSSIISAEEFDQLINMVESRNLTSHTYNVDLAEQISSLAENYYYIINNILQRLSL